MSFYDELEDFKIYALKKMVKNIFQIYGFYVSTKFIFVLFTFIFTFIFDLILFMPYDDLCYH